jgi:hypothetical protein
MSRKTIYSFESWDKEPKGEIPDCCKVAMDMEHTRLCSCGEHEVSITRMSGKIIAARILTVCHHTWAIQDYCADERDGVMLGPVCTKCGAIGEYVLGWEEAMALTVTDKRHKLEETERCIMLDDSASNQAKEKALKLLQIGDDHLTEAQQLARKSLQRKKS